jgi:anti-sigma regulatory factor (Ser/Thr protein kinase)
VTDALVSPLGAADDVALVALRNEPVGATMHLRLPADPYVLSHMRNALRRWLRGRGARPTEITAITLACTEACANAIEHAYAPGGGSVEIIAEHAAGNVTLVVRDRGQWRRPRGVHRSRGLKMIEATVDELDVRTTASGTEVVMRRRIGS